MPSRSWLLTPALVPLLVGSVTRDARGTSPKPFPHTALLLPGASGFIAQDDTDSLALYSATDGTVLRRFPARSWVNEIAFSPDGKSLLIIGPDELSLWDVGTGQRRWSRPASKAGLQGYSRPTFARDGRSFVGIGHRSDQRYAFEVALAGNTETGEWVGTVPSGQTDLAIDAVALSPDGARGILIARADLKAGGLFAFEVGQEHLVDTGVRGIRPLRYSADGKHVACRDPNSLGEEEGQKLRVVALNEGMKVRDVGPFTRIGRMAAAEDGLFLVTALRREKANDPAFPVGVQYSPRANEMKEVWRLEGEAHNFFGTPEAHQMLEMDFDLASLRGVYTTFDLRTRLLDLRTGEVLLTIDHSAEYWDDFSGWRGLRGILYWLAGLIPVAGLLVFFLRRRRRAG
jgi:hypothetical protein